MMSENINEQLRKECAIADKNNELFLLCNEWLNLKIEGRKISEYFYSNGYKNVAIYGASVLGKSLAKELLETNINVLFFIDKKLKKEIYNIKIYDMDTDFSKVDVIIVTPFTFFDEIKRELAKNAECTIVSLEEVIMSLRVGI